MLHLPDSPRKLVFRRIVKQLRNDPTLSRTARVLVAWEGTPTDGQELTIGKAPGLRLTPTCGPETWASNDSTRSWLFIDVDILIPGTDVGDMLDLWWAVERAIYPCDRAAQLAFQRELREPGGPEGSGALTGLIEFSQPAADDGPADQMQQARAQMRVEMRQCLVACHLASTASPTPARKGA